MTYPEKFWSLVRKQDDGCWIYTGTSSAGGYGSFYPGNYRSVAAHRYAYELAKGPIPSGMCVCHACDVRRCVNPDHLWVGTKRDNTQDMIRKGRRGYTGKRKTHCLRGHELSEATTTQMTLASGLVVRGCRACNTLRAQGRRRRMGILPRKTGPVITETITEASHA